ncbi:MAG: 3'-5' exonuclease [Gammaproteobacteria bacterium]
MNVFVFDIETVPDVATGRRLYDLQTLTDERVASVMQQRRRIQTGSEFLPHYLHRIVAIAIAMRSGDKFRVWSLGDEEADETELLRRFYEGLERYTPTLVSWNGSGFDLPVMHYRALLHGVQAPRYWESGEDDRSFRYDNYLSRYHRRHTDLMDVLSAYNGRAVAPLEAVAVMLGLPGKLGMSGAKVWDYFQSGDIQSIRNYCETDVLNTYLVYLRFELMRAQLTRSAYERELRLVRERLAEGQGEHFKAFLDAWPADSSLLSGDARAPARPGQAASAAQDPEQ